MKTINAIIESADLQLVYSNRLLDFPICLKLAGGGSVCFGGMVLCHAHDDDCNENYAGKYICKVFDVVGVNSVTDLVGKHVRAIFKKDAQYGDEIIGIQNFIENKKYFIPNLKEFESIDEKELLKL